MHRKKVKVVEMRLQMLRNNVKNETKMLWPLFIFIPHLMRVTKLVNSCCLLQNQFVRLSLAL